MRSSIAGSAERKAPGLRGYQEGRLVLTVTSAGKETDDIDLQRMLEQAGYRWDREDLDDVTIGLDFNLGVGGTAPHIMRQ